MRRALRRAYDARVLGETTMRPGYRLRLVSNHPEADAGGAPAERVVESLGLEQAFERFAPYVAAIGFRLLGRDHEVDDLVQEVFLHAVRGVGQLRNPDAVKAWLATVTVRVARRKLSARRLARLMGLDADLSYEHVAGNTAGPEQRMLIARVYAALDELPVSERLAWTLRHIQGEPLDSVAEACGCSLATAKRRIAAAHDKITVRVGHG